MSVQSSGAAAGGTAVESLSVPFSPSLLLQAALANTTNPTSSAQASSYLQSWVKADVGTSNQDNGSSWNAAADLISSFYPAPGTVNVRSLDMNGRGPIGVVEEAIINHHARAAAVEVNGENSGAGALSDRLLKTTASGVRTLLLTLLNSKIRACRSSGAPVSAGDGAISPSVINSLLNNAWSGLIHLSTEGTLKNIAVIRGEMNQLCITSSALAVRTSGGIAILISQLSSSFDAAKDLSNGQISSAQLSPIVALRVLSRVPSEATVCSTRTSGDIESEMATYVAFVLERVGMVLTCGLQGTKSAAVPEDLEDEAMKLALRALGNWAQCCKITLSQLLASVYPSQTDHPSSLLMLLISILSASSSPYSPSFDVIVEACQSLMVSVLNGNDYATTTRLAATTALLGGIPQVKFLLAPLNRASGAEWEGDEAARALANLASTIATEEIDLMVKCEIPGCFELIEILLELQTHRVQSAAIAPLEAWLAMQDVPIAGRHPSLNEQLFGKVVEAIIVRISYPCDFHSWEEDESDTLDRSEFEEMRRLASDVLISSYFLLRTQYVDGIISSIVSRNSSWEATESALWCLSAVGRDIIEEVKKKTEGGSEMGRKLVDLAQQLCSVPINQQHPLVQVAIMRYLGVFAQVWNIHASDSVLELLAFLKLCIENGGGKVGGKATRQVLLGCAKSLVQSAVAFIRTTSPDEANVVFVALSAIMGAAINDGDETAMRDVAEGSTRFCIMISDETLARRSLCFVVDPIVTRANLALTVMNSSQNQPHPDSSQIEASCQALVSCLGSFEEVCRFSDSHNSSGTHPLVDALTGIWPLLATLAESKVCRSHIEIMSAVLLVHAALLSNASELMSPHFSSTVTFIVSLYEDQKNPAALDYVAAAIEQFGSDNNSVASFTELLSHLTRCTAGYLTTERRPQDCPLLIEAFFDMTRRFLVFCPLALCSCVEFSTIFALGVACLNECSGSDGRAALLFLSQIIGYKSIRLSKEASAVMLAYSGIIDGRISQHGAAICQQCISSLSGGALQSLWPAYGECLYSLVSYCCSVDGGEILAQQWLFAAMEVEKVPLTNDVCERIILLLIGFGKDTTNRSKPRAKLLLGDFGKLCKGSVATSDVLSAYSLQ